MAFPSNPAQYTTHTIDDVSWIYNGYAWDKLDEGHFFQQDNPPEHFAKGDHWFNTLNGKLYIAIEDDSGLLWIEFSGIGGAFNVVIHETTNVSGATYEASSFDYYIGVSYDGRVTITLPADPATGQELVIKDEFGRAGNSYHQITIIGSGGDLIDNASEAIININNAALHVIYRNGWRII